MIWGPGLGVGGHLTALRRTRVGPYKLDRARRDAPGGVDDTRGGLPVMPLGEAAAAAFTRWDVAEAQARLLLNGARIPMPLFEGTGPIAAFGPDGRFLALVENQGGKAKSLAVFAV